MPRLLTLQISRTLVYGRRVEPKLNHYHTSSSRRFHPTGSKIAHPELVLPVEKPGAKDGGCCNTVQPRRTRWGGEDKFARFYDGRKLLRCVSISSGGEPGSWGC